MIIFFNDRCKLMFFYVTNYGMHVFCHLMKVSVTNVLILKQCFQTVFLLVLIARSKRGGWLKLLFVSKMPGAQLKLFVSIESIIILRASPPLHLARLVAAKKAHMVVASNLRRKVRCFFWSGMKLFVTFIAGRHLAWQWLMLSPESWYTCVEK